MSHALYNDTVDLAYKESIKDNILTKPKYYVTAKHGIRHTIVIHLLDYMDNRGLAPSPDFIAATYLAGDEYTQEPFQSVPIKGYIQMILILRENNYHPTLEMFENITDDEVVYLLIHLWVDLLFLDHHSRSKETKKYIRNYRVYIELVLKGLTTEPDKTINTEAFNTIADVLFTEINIVRRQRLDEGDRYYGV